MYIHTEIILNSNFKVKIKSFVTVLHKILNQNEICIQDMYTVNIYKQIHSHEYTIFTDNFVVNKYLIFKTLHKFINSDFKINYMTYTILNFQ